MHPGMILTIFRKDVRDSIRDSRVLAALLIAMGIGVFYNYMFDDDEFIIPNVNVVIVSQDESTLPEQLAAATEGTVSLSIQVDPDANARELVVDREAEIGIVIPVGFDERIAADEQPPLELFFLEQSGARIGFVLAALEQTLQEMAGRGPPAQILATVIPADEGQDFNVLEAIGMRHYFVLTAIVILIGLNAMLIVPIILAEEAEKKTLDALVMVASYADVVIAKALVGLFYVAVSGTALVAITGIDVDNVLLFAAAGLLLAVSLIGFGLLIGGMFSSANQVNTWGGFFLMPVIAPAFLVGLPLPDPVDLVLTLLPPSQAMRVMINSISTEALFSDIWLSFVVLLAWIVIAYGILILRLSRRQA